MTLKKDDFENHKYFMRTVKSYATVTEGTLKRIPASGEASWTYLKSNHDNGQLVMFVHGTGNDRFFLMYDIFIHLLSSGFSVFTFDLDGHGVGGSTIFNEYGILSCFNDWFSFVNENFSYKKLHVLGHSLGGLLAAHGIAVHQIKVDSLILIGVPTKIQIQPKKMFYELISPLSKVYRTHIIKWKLSSSLPAVGGFNRKRFPLRLQGQSGSFNYVALVSRLSYRLNFARNIKRVQGPILAIYGSQDRIAVSPEAQFDGYKNITFQSIKTSHFLLTIHPETYQLLDKWIKRFL